MEARSLPDNATIQSLLAKIGIKSNKVFPVPHPIAPNEAAPSPLSETTSAHASTSGGSASLEATSILPVPIKRPRGRPRKHFLTPSLTNTLTAKSNCTPTVVTLSTCGSISNKDAPPITTSAPLTYENTVNLSTVSDFQPQEINLSSDITCDLIEESVTIVTDPNDNSSTIPAQITMSEHLENENNLDIASDSALICSSKIATSLPSNVELYEENISSNAAKIDLNDEHVDVVSSSSGMSSALPSTVENETTISNKLVTDSVLLSTSPEVNCERSDAVLESQLKSASNNELSSNDHEEPLLLSDSDATPMIGFNPSIPNTTSESAAPVNAPPFLSNEAPNISMANQDAPNSDMPGLDPLMNSSVNTCFFLSEDMSLSLATEPLFSDENKTGELLCKPAQTPSDYAWKDFDKSEPEIHMCSLCNFHSTSKQYFQTHLKNSHPDLLKCKTCKFRAVSEEILAQHFKECHNQRCVCSECGFTAYGTALMKKHMEKHSNKVYTCDICKKNYKDQYILRMHKKLLHEPSSVFYECDTCSKSFNRKAHLKRHLRIHNPEKPFKCDYCDYKGCDKSVLKKHMLIHQDPKHTCDICGRTFRHLRNWHLHLKRHKGERDYKCGICNFYGYTLTDIKKHIERRHKDINVMLCENCHATFDNEQELKEHAESCGSIVCIQNDEREEGTMTISLSELEDLVASKKSSIIMVNGEPTMSQLIFNNQPFTILPPEGENVQVIRTPLTEELHQPLQIVEVNSDKSTNNEIPSGEKSASSEVPANCTEEEVTPIKMNKQSSLTL